MRNRTSRSAVRLIAIFTAFYSYLAPLSIYSFHAFHFGTFYRFQSAITGSREIPRKGGDGLIAIPGSEPPFSHHSSYRAAIIIRRLITFLEARSTVTAVSFLATSTTKESARAGVGERRANGCRGE